jgi:hypothetical protein
LFWVFQEPLLQGGAALITKRTLGEIEEVLDGQDDLVKVYWLARNRQVGVVGSRSPPSVLAKEWWLRGVLRFNNHGLASDT